MDFDQPSQPKKSNVFLPIILSLVLIIGIWLGYFLTLKFSNGLNSQQNQHASSNEKINR